MNTAEELAYAPRRKIERAIQHINDLRKAIDVFLSEKPFLLVAQLMKKYRPTMTIAGDGIVHFSTPEGDPLLRVQVNFVTKDMADSENEADVQPTFDIAFGKGQPLAGDEVLHSLKVMTDTVKEVVGLMIDAFISSDNIIP